MRQKKLSKRARGLARLTIGHSKLGQQISGILCLMYKKSKISIFNLKSKKIMEETKILKIKGRT